MSEVKKCPRCGNLMKEGASLGGVRLKKNFGDIIGDNVVPFYCENCGYVELYYGK